MIVTNSKPSVKLSTATYAVHGKLWAISEDGFFLKTVSEIADICNLSVTATRKHLKRLILNKLVFEFDRISVDGSRWKRLRKVIPLVSMGVQPKDGNCTDEQHCSKPATRPPVQNPKPKPLELLAPMPPSVSMGVQPKDGNWTDGPLLSTPYISNMHVKHMYALQIKKLRFFICNAKRPLAVSASISESEKMENHQLEQLIDNALNKDAKCREFDLLLLPPFPSAKVLSPICYPAMPKFTGDTYADAKMMIKAYKAHVLKSYGVRPRLDKNTIHRMKAVLPTLRKLGIDIPFAWVAFRFVSWKMSDLAKRTRPGIDYIFSRKVVEKNAGHFKSVASSYQVVKKVKLTPAHKTLLEKWELCRSAAACVKLPPGGVYTRRAVNSVLSKACYEKLVKLSKTQKSAAEAELHRALASGAWIW